MHQRRSSPQGGAKRLRQQQLQLGGSPVHHSGGGDKRPQRFWPCPVCNRSFALFRLDDHVNQCLDSSPCPQTSRSSPLTPLTPTDVSCQNSAPEWRLAASIRGRDECPNVPTSSTSSVSSVGAHKKFSLANSDLFRELSDSTSGAVLCSDRQRSGLDRQNDAFCLPTERNLPMETSSQLPPDENVLNGGGGHFSVGVEDRGKVKRSFELGDLGSSGESTDSGTRDCSAKNPWSDGKALDVGGLDEKGIVEDARDGTCEAFDRPPAGFKLFQRQVQSQARLSMFRNFSSAPLQRNPSVTVLQPGMVLFRGCLDLHTQQKFVQESHGVAHLFRRPSTAGGGKYHVYSMCWGSKWETKAHRYVPTGPENSIPSWMFDSAQKLARDAHQQTPVYPDDSNYAPDVGLVNFYPAKADELGVIGLGGHQDLDDSGLMPVVSVSVGDSMTFFYRRLPPFSRRKSGVSISVDEEAARSCQDGDAAHNREHQILLESGDVLVFGGKSRLVYHGTRHVQPGTRPPGLHMVPGRLNFTFRQTIARAG